MNRLKFLVVLLLSASTLPALALPGEANAVLAHCGTPISDTHGTSEVSNLPQRTLTYPDMRLNFESIGSGWSFTSGWHNHIPQNVNEVSNRMPCFRDALNEVTTTAANSPVDPTIQAQIASATPTNRATFGIGNLWLILFIAGFIAVFGILLPRTRRMVRGPKMRERPFRKPSLVLVNRFRRRRPTVTTAPEKL